MRVGAGFQAALRHKNHVVRHLLADPLRRFQVDLKGHEVPVVNAEQLHIERHGAVEFFHRVHLHEDIELTGFGDFKEVPQVLVVQGGNDEQNRIGASDGGFEDLRFVDGEILPQTGQPDGLPDLRQVGEVPLEKQLVGEHRDRVCSGRFVRRGNRHWIKVRGDDAGARGSLFDLGNQAELVGSAIEGGRKPAQVISQQRRLTQVLEARQQFRDFALLLFNDGRKAVRNHIADVAPGRASRYKKAMLSPAVSAALASPDPATATLQAAMAHFDCQTGTVHLLKEGLLRLAAHVNIPPPLLPIIDTVPIGKGIAGLAAERREPVSLCNLQTDTSGQARPNAKQTGMEGSLAVPMLVEGDLRGVFGIAKASAHDWTEAEKAELLEIAAALAQRTS